MTVLQSDRPESLEETLARLKQLYAISKLFASFENVEQTLDPALGIVAETLPLRSAILIETYDGRSQIFVWPSQGQSPDHIRAVKQHAETTYKYFIGVAEAEALELTERAGTTTLPGQPETEENLTNRLIVIPLVVAHHKPFGVLQLEGARHLDKADLMFVNAIGNQLAIALNRTRLYQQAQHAVGVRDQVLAVVSHDLKNPTATILLTLDGLGRKAPVVERRHGAPQALARIRRAAESMLRLINDLLDAASIEAGHMAIRCQPHDALAMLQETATTFEEVATENRLRLTTEVEPNLPKAWCDRDRILQVLSNLVANATKVTPEGGQITLRAEAREHELVFAVSDDGPGIGEEDLKHLFDRYWRSGEAEYQGTGLGLAIAKGIVDAHGGRLWPESTLGHGATFLFTVPGADADGRQRPVG